MAQSEVTFVGVDDQRRARRKWPLPGHTALRAQLFLCHGTHEHSGRYDALALACGEAGIEMLAVDFRGHGLSAGARGDFGTLEGAIGDVVDLVVSSSVRRVPIIILGHSLGSMVAFLTAHRLAMDPALPTPSMAVITGFAMDSVSPPFGFKSLIPVLEKVPSAIRAICSQLAKVNPMGPACPLPRPNELTSFGDRAAEKLTDPLMYHGWIQNRTALALLDARAGCQALLPAFGAAFPFLVVHGGADSLCPRSAADSLMAASPQRDKELKVLPGLLHEVLDSPAARKHVAEWCKARLEPRSRL